MRSTPLNTYTLTKIHLLNNKKAIFYGKHNLTSEILNILTEILRNMILNIAESSALIHYIVGCANWRFQSELDELDPLIDL